MIAARAATTSPSTIPASGVQPSSHNVPSNSPAVDWISESPGRQPFHEVGTLTAKTLPSRTLGSVVISFCETKRTS